MSFLEQHPNYLSYSCDSYYVNRLPDNESEQWWNIAYKLRDFVFAVVDKLINNKFPTNEKLDYDMIVRKKRYRCNILKCLVNDVVARASCKEPTSNWGDPFLGDDLETYTYACAAKLPYILDSLEIMYEKEFTEIGEINSLLEDMNIGYCAEKNEKDKINWKLRDNSVNDIVKPIENAINAAKDICEQTIDHLKQAKKHAADNKSDREKKDAVRDCLSAMESLLNEITGDRDIKNAVSILKKSKKYGKDIIVKDGLSIWNHIHELYPDVRHGSSDSSELTTEEYLYWIERINAYVVYVCGVYNKIQNEQRQRTTKIIDAIPSAQKSEQHYTTKIDDDIPF